MWGRQGGGLYLDTGEGRGAVKKPIRRLAERAFFIGRNPNQPLIDGTLNVISADRLFGISAVPKVRVVTFIRKAVVNLSGKCT